MEQVFTQSESSQTFNLHLHDHQNQNTNTFGVLMKELTAYFDAVRAKYKHLFVADVDGDTLFEAYLSGFTTPQTRQYHNCNCCKAFFRKYAGLVYIHPETYESVSAFVPAKTYTEIHPEFVAGLSKVRELVNGASIKSVFYSDENRLGYNAKGGWEHFYMDTCGEYMGPSRVKTAGQNMAEAREDSRILREGLHRFPIALYETAHRYFTMDAVLKHYEKQIGMLTWAINLLEFRRSTENKRAISNRMWMEVATQSKGRLHIAQGVLGNYLETLGQGKPDEAKRNFLDQVDPADYMRPKAAPTQTTVNRAEEIVAKLGVKDSLRRRSLRRDELTDTIWKPKAKVQAEKDAVFANIKTKDAKSPLPNQNVIGGQMTVGKFLRDIVPGAERIVFVIPNTPSKQYFSYTTAAVEDSPSIFNHGKKTSSYHYQEPTAPHHWGLAYGDRVEVCAITGNLESPGNNDRFNLVLEKGYDKNQPVAAIFPQELAREFHEVRSVIESFSNSNKLEKPEEGLVAWNPFGPVPSDVWVYTNDGYTAVSYRLINME